MIAEKALALARRGFKVFPLEPNSKTPPLIRDWPQKATTDTKQIAEWWLVTPTANVGIHCEGMVVVDVDPRNGGDASLDYLEMMDGVPPTLTTITPSGGRHLFYKLPEGHPGVKNSAGKVMRGIDIKSTRGYVLGPGSVIAAGEYKFDPAVTEIADAPEWLVRECGLFTEREQSPGVNIPDAPPEIVAQAREWVQMQDRAIQGQGGDARTFAVACGLRDRALSQAQALDLLQDWNTSCEPPWDLNDLETKVRHAYKYATGEVGSKAVLPTDFPIVGPAEPPKPQPKPTGIFSLADMAKREVRAEYLIKGLIQKNSYVMFYGDSGQGKTFAALDMAYCIAAGKEWFGRRVKQAPVLYIGFEAFGGLHRRAQALQRKHGAGEVPLFFMPGTFNLRDPEGRRALAAAISELPEVPQFIVMDTLAYALQGGDENSAQDVGAFNSAVQALIQATGACVMVIHHTGKDATKGARGSSALRAAVDSEIEVANRGIRPTKQRDMEIGQTIGFKLVPVQLGIDSDGDPITSCVVKESTVAPPDVRAAKLREGSRPKMMWDALCEGWPTNEPVHVDQWFDACREFLPTSDKAAKEAFRKDKFRLRELIHEDRDMITRRMQ